MPAAARPASEPDTELEAESGSNLDSVLEEIGADVRGEDLLDVQEDVLEDVQDGVREDVQKGVQRDAQEDADYVEEVPVLSSFRDSEAVPIPRPVVDEESLFAIPRLAADWQPGKCPCTRAGLTTKASGALASQGIPLVPQI